MYIYKTINLVNKKIYVGKSKKEINESLNYLGSGKLIKRAIKKYGKKNFKKEIIQICTSLKELNIQEIFWIAELDTIKNGYNISKGGDGGDTISNHPDKKNIFERQKITKLEKNVGKGEKNHRFGKHLSIDHKQKISLNIKEQYATGRINRYRMTEEGKKKMSIWMKEHCPTKTPQGRLKNRENNLGSKNPNACIYEFTSPDKKIFKVIGNVKQFCLLNNISYKKIIKIYNTEESLNGWKCKKISRAHNNN